MPVSENLAMTSDWLLVLTLLGYSLAMLLFAGEYAFGARGRVARTAVAARPARELVGAGGPPVSAPPTGLVAGTEPPQPRLAVTLGRLAVGVTTVAWLLHAGSLLLRGLSVERVPWGNMYEFSSAVSFAAVTAFLGLLTRQRVRYLGAFVLLPVVLYLGLAAMALYADARPLIPALQSSWLKIHVAAAIISTGVFFVAGVVTALYLARLRSDRRATSSRLPAAEVLDRTAYRLIAFGFPIWTFAVIAGAIWAERAWGRYWGWDPKETWAFISWVLYAGYLHARSTAGWRGKPTAIIALVAFASMLANYFGVNLWITGLHSYAGT